MEILNVNVRMCRMMFQELYQIFVEASEQHLLPLFSQEQSLFHGYKCLACSSSAKENFAAIFLGFLQDPFLLIGEDHIRLLIPDVQFIPQSIEHAKRRSKHLPQQKP